MSLKRIFWSMLAGVSFSLAGAGCEEENPPADTTTDDLQVEEAADVQQEDVTTDRQDVQEVTEAAEVTPDAEPDGEVPQTDYGPPPDATP